MSSMVRERFAAIALETSCPQCGGPIPLNGPVRFPACGTCGAVIAIGPRIWEAVFAEIAGGVCGTVAAGAHRFSLLTGVDRPHCTRCGVEVPLGQIGGDGVAYCFACGNPYESFPPPPWLVALVPDAIQIVGADREGGARPPASPRRWFVRFWDELDLTATLA